MPRSTQLQARDLRIYGQDTAFGPGSKEPKTPCNDDHEQGQWRRQRDRTWHDSDPGRLRDRIWCFWRRTLATLAGVVTAQEDGVGTRVLVRGGAGLVRYRWIRHSLSLDAQRGSGFAAEGLAPEVKSSERLPRYGIGSAWAPSNCGLPGEKHHTRRRCLTNSQNDASDVRVTWVFSGMLAHWLVSQQKFASVDVQ